MRKGFTLLELIVVIIILGILASVGFGQYARMVEKGRSAEAKVVLGQLRSAQAAYWQEWGTYSANIGSLIVSAPTDCQTTHFFQYSTSGSAAGICRAIRCTAGGKAPPVVAASVYSLTLNHLGSWGGTAGFF